MGVVTEIAEYILRAAKRPFAVSHPFMAKQLADEGVKRLRIRKMLRLALEADSFPIESILESLPELAVKNDPQHFLRQKEAIARIRTDPALMIERQSTGGNDTVDMGMVIQSLRPGMEHAKEANLRTEVFGIAGNFDQGFRTESQ